MSAIKHVNTSGQGLSSDDV